MVFTACCFELAGDHIGRAGPAFLTLAYVELDFLTLGEGSVAVRLDLGVMDEDVLITAIGRDEPKPFLLVKPFHCSCTHNRTPYAHNRA